MKNSGGLLSTHFPSRFYADNERFETVEQFIQWNKAMIVDDMESAELILKEKNPVRCTMIGDKIVVDAHMWDVAYRSLLKEGTKHKLMEHDDVLDDIKQIDVSKYPESHQEIFREVLNEI